MKKKAQTDRHNQWGQHLVIRHHRKRQKTLEHTHTHMLAQRRVGVMLICTYRVGEQRTCHITRFHFLYNLLHNVIRHHIKDRLSDWRGQIYSSAHGQAITQCMLKYSHKFKMKANAYLRSHLPDFPGLDGESDLTFFFFSFFKNLVSLQSLNFAVKITYAPVLGCMSLNPVYFDISPSESQEYIYSSSLITGYHVQLFFLPFSMDIFLLCSPRTLML